MQPEKEALCDVVVFTPIYVPSTGQGCASKDRLAFHLSGPGEAECRNSNAEIDNTGIIFFQCDATQTGYLTAFIHSFFQSVIVRGIFQPSFPSCLQCKPQHSSAAI